MRFSFGVDTNISGFLGLTSCSLVEIDWLLEESVAYEYGEKTWHRNFTKSLPDYTVSHPRTQHSWKLWCEE